MNYKRSENDYPRLRVIFIAWQLNAEGKPLIGLWHVDGRLNVTWKWNAEGKLVVGYGNPKEEPLIG